MRWPALVGLIALAIVGAVYRAARPPQAPMVVSEQARRGAHLRALRDSILRADIREGLATRAIRAAPAEGGLVVVTRDSDGALHALPDSERRHVTLAWQRAVGGAAHVPSFLVVDEFAGRTVTPPGSGQGAACWSSHWTVEAIWRGGQLGPCAWYATLGEPSATVGAWLQANGALQHALPPHFVQTDSTPALYGERYAALGFAGPLSGMTPPAYIASPKAVRCASGDVRSCTGADRESDELALPPGAWVYFGGAVGLGGYQSYLLRDLDHEFGRERLEAFWRSSGPIPDAFLSAFGVPLNDWLAPHLRGYLGTVELGAGDVGRAALSALVWTVLLGMLGWWAARRLRY